MASLKRYFLYKKKNPDVFIWKFAGRRPIDAGEGTESFAAIVQPFLSYHENPAGGRYSPPPPHRGAC